MVICEYFRINIELRTSPIIPNISHVLVIHVKPCDIGIFPGRQSQTIQTSAEEPGTRRGRDRQMRGSELEFDMLSSGMTCSERLENSANGEWADNRLKRPEECVRSTGTTDSLFASE
jgi:hypothetical protein